MAGPEAQSNAAPKQASADTLVSFEEAQTKMTSEEKTQFEQLRADYIQALDISKPVLRQLSMRREALMNEIKLINLEFLASAIGSGVAIAALNPWRLGMSSVKNLGAMINAIRANIETAKIDDLDYYANQLGQASNDLGKRFSGFKKSMQKKYSFMNA